MQLSRFLVFSLKLLQALCALSLANTWFGGVLVLSVSYSLLMAVFRDTFFMVVGVTNNKNSLYYNKGRLSPTS